jgi:Rod binding domain-containing protein
VEEFRKGVNISASGQQTAASRNAASKTSPITGPNINSNVIESPGEQNAAGFKSQAPQTSAGSNQRADQKNANLSEISRQQTNPTGTSQNQADLAGSGLGLSNIAETLPQGSLGQRYRPLESGRMADAKSKSAHLTEQQKLEQLQRIKESAEEYEGMLINEMIKSMRQSPFVETAGSDTYSEIAEKPFTAALTAAGGLGLSQTIINQVAAQEGLDDVLAKYPEAMGPNWRQRLAPSQMSKPVGRFASSAVKPTGSPGQEQIPASPAQGAAEHSDAVVQTEPQGQ